MFLFPGKRRKLLSDRKQLGDWGERHCEKFLKKQGYMFVARNFSCKSGEIDLVMFSDEGVVVFVEVKTRQSEEFAPAQAAVGFRNSFPCQQNNTPMNLDLDVIIFTKTGVGINFINNVNLK